MVYYSPDVFMHAEPGDRLFMQAPLSYKGLHMIYYKNPKKNAKCPSSFCYFQYNVGYTYKPIEIIEVNVLCDFTGPKPAFIVAKVTPDWVGCADPLLRVEFQEKPLGTTTLSEASVTKNAIKYTLPFVAGEDPHLDIICESNKATMVFDFGPEDKQSITIDFLNDLAMKFSPPKEQKTLPRETIELFWKFIAENGEKKNRPLFLQSRS